MGLVVNFYFYFKIIKITKFCVFHFNYYYYFILFNRYYNNNKNKNHHCI